MTSRIGVGNAAFHTGGSAAPADTVYLGVFRREVLERLGGYNVEFIRAQDWELNYRIREAGHLIWFSPELRVSYRPRPSVRTLARQYRDYGRWRRVVTRYHRGSVNLRYVAAPAALLALVAGVVVGAAVTPWALLVPAAYVAGITLGSLPAGRGLPFGARVRIPLALATMHTVLGLRLPHQPAVAGPPGHRQPPPRRTGRRADGRGNGLGHGGARGELTRAAAPWRRDGTRETRQRGPARRTSAGPGPFHR